MLPRRVLAWLPPGDFLWSRVFHRRRWLKAVTVEGTLTIHDADLPEGTREVTRTLHLKLPVEMRVEVSSPKGEYTEIADGARRVILKGDVPARKGADRPDVWRALLIGDEDRLLAAARAAGVDLEVVSLSRMERTDDKGQTQSIICWVVGAKEGQDEPPQLWLDKNTYKPLRFKYRGPSSSARAIDLDQWSRGVGRGWFPGMIVRRKGDQVVDEYRVSKVRTNPKFDETFFRVATAKAN
jgi:hypothetical protein